MKEKSSSLQLCEKGSGSNCLSKESKSTPNRFNRKEALRLSRSLATGLWFRCIKRYAGFGLRR